ncbi:hypothetical protein OSTOST_06220 [Ostertagia ostertagi]
MLQVMRPHRSAVTRLAIDEPGNYVMSCANDGRVVISGIGCNNLNHTVFRGGEQDGFITQCSWRQSLIAFTCDKGTRIFDSSFSIYFQSTDGEESSVSQNGPSPVVQLCLLAPETYSTYRLLAEDRLSFSSKTYSHPCQFSMAGVPTFESYFLISSSDLVMATPYCAEDTLKWRIENDFLEEAWEFARERNAELEESKWDSRTVGRVMIEHLLSSGKPRLAAARVTERSYFCIRNLIINGIFKNFSSFQHQAHNWSQSVMKRYFKLHYTMTSIFLNVWSSNGLLRCTEQNEGGMYIYSTRALVLHYVCPLLNCDVQGWLIGLTLRRIQEVLSSSDQSDALSPKEEVRLYHALAHLYVHERKFDSAIKIYTNLRDQQVFAVIDKYQLFEHVKEQISELMLINSDRTLRLLLDNEDSVPAALVMTTMARQAQSAAMVSHSEIARGAASRAMMAPHTHSWQFILQDIKYSPRCSIFQMAYLTKLLSKNEGAEFADQAVRLYAEYDRKKLMPFLRKNENYQINRALEVCRQKNFVRRGKKKSRGKKGYLLQPRPSMILLLGKSGNHVDALDLMVRKYNQLDKAVEYCQVSVNGTISAEHDDPDLWTRLIEEIPPTMSVPGLRNALVSVLRNYEAHVELQQGCHESTRGDVRELLMAYLKTQALAIPVGARCSTCSCIPLSTPDKGGTDQRMLNCGHLPHAVLP